MLIKIVCAAIRSTGGHVICGVRHFDMIMHKQIDKLPPEFKDAKWEQGFVDNMGAFKTREEALQIVKESGQPFDEERNGNPKDKLFSEGIY